MTMTRHHHRANFADMARGFGAIDAMLQRLGEGWTHDIDGHAVFFDAPSGRWHEISAALNGWIALWERLIVRYALAIDLQPVRDISAHLRAGAEVAPKLVAEAVETITACKRAYRRMNMHDVRTIVRTQLIANAAEAAGLTSETAA